MTTCSSPAACRSRQPPTWPRCATAHPGCTHAIRHQEAHTLSRHACTQRCAQEAHSQEARAQGALTHPVQPDRCTRPRGVAAHMHRSSKRRARTQARAHPHAVRLKKGNRSLSLGLLRRLPACICLRSTTRMWPAQSAVPKS